MNGDTKNKNVPWNWAESMLTLNYEMLSWRNDKENSNMFSERWKVLQLLRDDQKEQPRTLLNLGSVARCHSCVRFSTGCIRLSCKDREVFLTNPWFWLRVKNRAAIFHHKVSYLHQRAVMIFLKAWLLCSYQRQMIRFTLLWTFLWTKCIACWKHTAPFLYFLCICVL